MVDIAYLEACNGGFGCCSFDESFSSRFASNSIHYELLRKAQKVCLLSGGFAELGHLGSSWMLA